MEQIKDYKIIRQRRKTVALFINPDATLTVKAPYLVPRFFIDQFIKEKSAWIREKLMMMSGRPQLTKKKFIEGEEFLFLGKSYTLKIIHNSTIELKEHLYFPFKNQRSIKKRIMDWYRDHALSQVTKRVEEYAKIMNVQYENITLSNAKRRWGACTGTNELSFNWRLVMAPLHIMDYVVVHELAHIKEKNHSRKFWDLVGKYCPDFKVKRRWLQRNGHALDII